MSTAIELPASRVIEMCERAIESIEEDSRRTHKRARELEGRIGSLCAFDVMGPILEERDHERSREAMDKALHLARACEYDSMMVSAHDYWLICKWTAPHEPDPGLVSPENYIEPEGKKGAATSGVVVVLIFVFGVGLIIFMNT